MSIPTSVSRLAEYYRRHDLWATMRRAGLALRRALFSSREILLYCDLTRQTSLPPDLPSSLEVERKRSSAELSPEDLQEMTSFWNPKLAHRNINERFGKGALLWVIKSQDRLAGYVWTLQGRTIEPHYFPLGRDDVHFFDLYVFPKYRGRSVNWFLIIHILHRLMADGAVRAFSEVAEWNQASLSSFKMTPFRRLGSARKLMIFHRTFVCWEQHEAVRAMREGTHDSLSGSAIDRRASKDKISLRPRPKVASPL